MTIKVYCHHTWLHQFKDWLIEVRIMYHLYGTFAKPAINGQLNTVYHQGNEVKLEEEQDHILKEEVDINQEMCQQR